MTKEDIWEINKEYDRIRDDLMDDPDPSVWERSKADYTQKKFDSYKKKLCSLSGEQRSEFETRFQREMVRAIELGELDRNSFGPQRTRELDELLNKGRSKPSLLRRVKRKIAALAR